MAVTDETRDDLTNTTEWVREADDGLQAARASRDRAVRRALDTGATVTEVVAITGLSRERIYQVRDRRR